MREASLRVSSDAKYQPKADINHAAEEFQDNLDYARGVLTRLDDLIKLMTRRDDSTIQKNDADLSLKLLHTLDDAAVLALQLHIRRVLPTQNQPKSSYSTRADTAQALWLDFCKAKTPLTRQKAAKAMLAFKREVKLGWSAMGLPEDAQEILADVW